MEKILLAAIKTGDNQVSVALQPDSRHNSIFNHLAEIGFDVLKCKAGFLTSHGRFVDRIEAKKIAIELGVIDPTKITRPQLYSDDLWG
jgi:hypothetical protein